jgi:hypothetical protein
MSRTLVRCALCLVLAATFVFVLRVRLAEADDITVICDYGAPPCTTCSWEYPPDSGEWYFEQVCAYSSDGPPCPRWQVYTFRQENHTASVWVYWNC